MRLKFCLLGDGAVGKTSLLNRYVDNTFDDKYLPTIGTNVSTKKIWVEKPEFGKIFEIEAVIWDIMGQLSFRKLLHPAYLRGAIGAILVCDLTRKETLENLDNWIDSLYTEWCWVPSIIVANKSDLETETELSDEDIRKTAMYFDFPFYKSSAKTNENVQDIFKALAEEVINCMVINDYQFKRQNGNHIPMINDNSHRTAGVPCGTPLPFQNIGSQESLVQNGPNQVKNFK
jgi:small GTP-binding protein